eukprot:2969321-Lingulodinium_polyedra.AAC.1
MISGAAGGGKAVAAGSAASSSGTTTAGGTAGAATAEGEDTDSDNPLDDLSEVDYECEFPNMQWWEDVKWGTL